MGMYHIMIKGIDKRDLFLTDSDYKNSTGVRNRQLSRVLNIGRGILDKNNQQAKQNVPTASLAFAAAD